MCLFGLRLEFPTGRDFLVPRDNGTEVPSLSRDKGTMAQAQNLSAERAGLLTACPVPSRHIPGQPRDKRKKIIKKLQFLKKEIFFEIFFFLRFFLPRFCPGTSQDRRVWKFYYKRVFLYILIIIKTFTSKKT
jgi:hypothetical protein